MRKDRILLILGVWVVILPYLGFPYSLKNILFSLTGLGIVCVGFMLYKEYKESKIGETEKKTFDNFSENHPT